MSLPHRPGWMARSARVRGPTAPLIRSARILPYPRCPPSHGRLLVSVGTAHWEEEPDRTKEQEEQPQRTENHNRQDGEDCCAKGLASAGGADCPLGTAKLPELPESIKMEQRRKCDHSENGSPKGPGRQPVADERL